MVQKQKTTKKPKVKRFKGLNPGYDIADAVALMAGRNKTRKSAIWCEFIGIGVIIFIFGMLFNTLFLTPVYEPTESKEYIELKTEYKRLQKYHTDKWTYVCETYGDYICTGEADPSLIRADVIEFTAPNTGV